MSIILLTKVTGLKMEFILLAYLLSSPFIAWHLYRKSLNKHAELSPFKRHARATAKVIFIFYVILFLIGLISGMTQNNETTESNGLEPEPEQTTEANNSKATETNEAQPKASQIKQQKPEITKELVLETLKQLQKDYAIQSKLLLTKAKNDYNKPREIFILWRLNEWLPKVDPIEKKYSDFVQENRVSIQNIGSFNLTSALLAMSDLRLASLYLMYGVRDQDESQLDFGANQVMEGFEKIQAEIDLLSENN
jgi:hypothetical protein